MTAPSGGQVPRLSEDDAGVKAMPRGRLSAIEPDKSQEFYKTRPLCVSCSQTSLPDRITRMSRLLLPQSGVPHRLRSTCPCQEARNPCNRDRCACVPAHPCNSPSISRWPVWAPIRAGASRNRSMCTSRPSEDPRAGDHAAAAAAAA